MKVTSFEISKKLKELGFEAETIFYYYEDWSGADLEVRYQESGVKKVQGECYISAYDLEVILDALPMGIDRDDKRYNLIIEQRVFFYYSDDDGNELEEFSIMQEEEESLADIAARLLIKLHEAGLIKFDKE